MSDIQEQIRQLQNQAADCELMGSLAVDPELRALARRRAEHLHQQIRELRNGKPDASAA